jgi:integrase
MPKLTKAWIDLQPLPEREAFHWDSELRGFGLRSKPSGVRTFLIQYRTKHGRTRRYAFGRYGVLTPEEARKRASKLLAGVAAGGDPSAQRKSDRAAVTVAELCDEYLAKAKGGQALTRRGQAKKASTLSTDAGRIERHIKPLLGDRAVVELNPQDIITFQEDVIGGKTATDIRTGPRGRARVTGGAGTAARTMGLLGAILTYAVPRYRADNPARGVRRPAGKRRAISVSLEQYAALGAALKVAEARGEPWQAILAIQLLALTGCRRGEIEGLRWREVDRAGGCLRLGDTKTGFSVRPLGSSAIALLRATEGEYVLPAIRSSDKPYGGLPNAWDRIVKGDGLDGLTAHSLRHGFAAVADELGYTVPTIGALLGHARRGTTGGYIAKVDSALAAAAERVSGTIWRAMTGEAGQVVPLRA